MCVPRDREELENVASPELLRVTLLASVVAPSVKITVPTAIPAPGATTVTPAVKVTGCPTTDGEGDEVTAVLVEALLTTWGDAESSPLVLWKEPSPL